MSATEHQMQSRYETAADTLRAVWRRSPVTICCSS
jgi:hypothetical protein